MSKRSLKKVVTKNVGLGGIGIPANIVPSSSNGNLPGQPFSTPQTTVTGWPVANLWYAQGRDAAKKVYNEYLNTLNQYTHAPADQVEQKASLASQLNNLIVSVIQGVTIALEAAEKASQRARMGDQAGVIEKDVVNYTLGEMLKLVWVHDTAAASQQFGGLDVQAIESSVVGRLKRVNDWPVTEVGIPLLSVQEADTLFMDEPLRPPLDAAADQNEITAEAPIESETSIMPTDEAPPPENEAAHAYDAVPNEDTLEVDEEEPFLEVDDESVGEDMPKTQEEFQAQETPQQPEETPPEDSTEVSAEPSEEIPAESPVEAPEETAEEVPAEVTEESPVEEEIPVETPEEVPEETSEVDVAREQVAAVVHDVWARWVQHLFASGEIDTEGKMTIPASDVTRWQRQIETPYAELSDEEKAKDQEVADKIIAAMGEEPVETTEEVVTEEAPVEETIPEETPEKIPEEGLEEEPPPEEVVEEEPLPEEEDFIYCPECDMDVTEADIAACTNENCPHKQIEEEPSVEQKGIVVIVDHERDHCDCDTCKIQIKGFDGVEGDFCLDHKGIISYEFDRGTWSAADAKMFVQKQITNKGKDSTQKIDTLDVVILKDYLTPEETLPSIDFGVMKKMISDALSLKFEPLKKRLERLEQ